MTETSFALTEDLGIAAVAGACALLLISLALLVLELRRNETRNRWVFVTGVLSTLALGLALFRPVVVTAKTNKLGPRIVLLVDQSRRLDLPADNTTRSELAENAVQVLRSHYADARLSVLGFGEGEPRALNKQGSRRTSSSDLVSAVEHLAQAPGERPQALVVVSDGRLTRPDEAPSAESLKQAFAGLDVPIHTVSLVENAPRDASIRSVRAAGAAVAHQKLAITVEVGCSPDLDCKRVPIRIRELLLGERPLELASGAANAESGRGEVEMEITLDRAGSRVIEVSIDTPDGDTIADNNVRYLTFSVAKERIRLLHLAGRPTYDVRALRLWLKSDESVDVVAFFILRGETDDPGAGERDLALIRFPVDELFTEHLPSFDAVILQDIDAVRYKLSRYLVGLESYVKKGGGLIMVGGPSSFAGGNYAGTPLDSILPVEQPRRGKPTDPTAFVPSFTEAGRAAPVTAKLRSLLGGQLPEMFGANMLGAARPGAIALLEHPTLSVGAQAMPVLALGEAGDGRSIALGVDSTHRLAFGELASQASGRAYGALWDGLLGWLMRDPRYEAARVELVGECIAGEPVTLRVHRLPGMIGDITLTLESLGATKRPPIARAIKDTRSSSAEVTLDKLEAGGYAARVVVGAAPATRHDFGCERGGEAWSDSRPDNARLAAIAEATNGTSVNLDQVKFLPLPEVTEVTAERHASPLLPAWVWALLSTGLLGVHWITRRQSGLT
ncbi:MAG: hypothetical protein RJA70_828 [Pseudomonadota bacterium]|jgi:uncharacterized membrane protein